MQIIEKQLEISFIPAGFPSPAEDFTDLSISLDKYLIRNPSATFMAYANGDSMVQIGIHDGDILIVDRSLTAKDGDIVVALICGEFTVKQLSHAHNEPVLIPYNSQYHPIKVTAEMDFEIWGVVPYSIRKYR
jgi:DNA polymerase V